MTPANFAVVDGDLFEIAWTEPAPGYEAEGSLLVELHKVDAEFMCPTCERPTQRMHFADPLDERL